jgi:hypothetical protein
MEQLVIILLIALISIINWIVQKSKEAREKRKLEKRADATGEPMPKREAAAPDMTETAMRRLREALGLPEDAEPPVIPKRVEPPRRAEPSKAEQPVSPPPAPPARTLPPPLLKPETKPVLLHRSPARLWEEFRRVEMHHRIAPPLVHEPPKPPPRVRELLQSQGGLRDAVVLSEILGPPKSLREGSRPS